MSSFPGNFRIVHESDITSFSGAFWQNFGFRPMAQNSLSSSSSSLVLDSERGELVKAPARFVQKGIAEAKAKAALKNHSEAEKKRRERINSHLTILRSLVPSTDKMDKASLLAEVISHMKELKQHATEVSEGYLVPTDFDEVRVESDADGINKGSFVIKASLCCEDRPELLSDLKHALQALRLTMVRAEIATLGGRIRNVFVMNYEGNVSDNERRIFANSVRQALKTVLDRFSSPEFSPRMDLPNKRQGMSLFESSSSSS